MISSVSRARVVDESASEAAGSGAAGGCGGSAILQQPFKHHFCLKNLEKRENKENGFYLFFFFFFLTVGKFCERERARVKVVSDYNSWPF